jgi:hypothetical protein
VAEMPFDNLKVCEPKGEHLGGVRGKRAEPKMRIMKTMKNETAF